MDKKFLLSDRLRRFNHLDRFTPDQFLELMPEQYFEMMDIDDMEKQYLELYQLQTGIKEVVRRRGDIERFSLHKFCYEILGEELLKMLPYSRKSVTLYRFFFNQKANFMLTACYSDLLNSPRRDEFDIPASKPYQNHFFEGDRLVNTRPFIIDHSTDQESSFDIIAVNISRITLIKNITETFHKQQIAPVFGEIWQLRSPRNKLRSFYLMRARFDTAFSEEKKRSIMEDLTRYLHSYIKPMSIFDMIGPGMVGPSSSHTAGANKIGGIARNMIEGVIKSGIDVTGISVKLFGSFRDTGIGHKTPSALGGGLAGYAADYPELMQVGDTDYLKQNGIIFNHKIIPFRGFFKGSSGEEMAYCQERSSNIAEILVACDRGTMIITGCSIGGGNVVIRYFNRFPIDFELNERTRFYIDFAGVYVQKEGDSVAVQSLVPIKKGVKKGGPLPFNTFEELLFYLRHKKRDLIDLILDVEQQRQGDNRREVYHKMKQTWHMMQRSIYGGLQDDQKSFLGLTGGDSIKIDRYRKATPLFDNLYGEAMGYATAVNEQNARGKLIVACPTAGSCGILPGVLEAYRNRNDVDELKILESIMVSGFLGMILFDDVTTAGADFGCQAEVGAATAMTAGALVYLEGGTPEQIVQGFTLGLKNCLGLICDPVAGLVEVPCVKRNGLYTSMAISAGMMALSGVTSFISPDEVVLTMKEVGERIHRDYKETAKGGLAQTRDGKAVEAAMEVEIQRFFEDE